MADMTGGDLGGLSVRLPYEIKQHREELARIGAETGDVGVTAAADALKWVQKGRTPAAIKEWRDDLEKELARPMSGQHWLGTRGALDALRWVLQETA